MKFFAILVLVSSLFGCVSVKAQRQCDAAKGGDGCRNYWIGELYLLDYRDIRHYQKEYANPMRMFK